MNIGLYGVKGGSGVTTTAVLLFSIMAQRGDEVTLVTTADGMAAAGLDTYAGTAEVGERGRAINTDVMKGYAPADDATGTIITDGFSTGTSENLLVLRPCYLTLRRAVQADTLPNTKGIILITEMGRALTRGDVERAVGLPVLAEIPFDPSISRASDAGLLSCRIPLAASKPLGSLLPVSV